MPNFEDEKEEKSPFAYMSPIEPQLDLPATTSNMNAYPSLGRNFSIRRTFSKMSKRSYISNLSMINKKNLARFGKSKIAFIGVNLLVR